MGGAKNNLGGAFAPLAPPGAATDHIKRDLKRMFNNNATVVHTYKYTPSNNSWHRFA
jgi:hypothetical protein